MASLLRQIVASPRAKHAETGLDFCYVTSNVIATSGPSQTYPQRAYRNPLDRLVAFLDSKHNKDWAIWEFRAEGTGYPDDAVYGRIRHYPWPDHHPPPFRLVPMIMASMRNWIAGGELEGVKVHSPKKSHPKDQIGKNERVIIVHCKAGKGRSGTMACSYLISECGWTPEDALARFTQRRMRPNFGSGVSIPSQLRWISYVDRWQKGGKKFEDREVEIVEMHVWGLRHGVKVAIEGFAEEGKKIHTFHTFRADERFVIEGDAPGGNGVRDLVSDMADTIRSPVEGFDDIAEEDPDYNEVIERNGSAKTSEAGSDKTGSSTPERSKSKKLKSSRTTGILRSLSKSRSRSRPKRESENGAQTPEKSKTIDLSAASASLSSDKLSETTDGKTQSQSSLPRTQTFAALDEPGGRAVILKPKEPLRIPNGDVNVSIERRNRAPASMGLTMVTAVAHVWFNTFFEGNGPEQDGKANDSGVFEIDWERMDGIKGSSRKGTKAADRIAVVWRTVEAQTHEEKRVGKLPEVKVDEPSVGETVPQMEPADWTGENAHDPEAKKFLGLRKADTDSSGVSKASTVKSQEIEGNGGKSGEVGKKDDVLEGLKTSGPGGETTQS